MSLPKQFTKYFSIPLEQGLRLNFDGVHYLSGKYFSIPLEQGLRPIKFPSESSSLLYFSIPLEQGLRLYMMTVNHFFTNSILVFH